MAEPLIIVGAGGHGRETAFAHQLANPPDSFLGFLDDRCTGATAEGWPVLGTIDAAARIPHARFVIAINDPRVRRTVAERLRVLGVARWASVIHPEVRLHRTVQLGIGCSILGGSQVTTSIRIGDHCIVNRGCHVSHDAAIGDYCSLNPGACIAGGVSIGDGCEIGSASSVRQGTRIGRGATIGMGAVVLRDVPDDAVVAGCPARLLRSNDPW
jgi:sugar O-acyltransferase (sialic acid O-acetyltransferase NeuD family)